MNEAGPLDPCVHCGFCLPACPTYLATGDEADSPRGRIVLMRALERGEIGSDDEALRQHLDACLGCRGCEPVCPAGVAYGRGLEAARTTIAAREGLPVAARIALGIFRAPWLWRGLFSAARVVRDLGVARLFVGTDRTGFGLAMLEATRPVPVGGAYDRAGSTYAATVAAAGGLPPRTHGRTHGRDPAEKRARPYARSGNPPTFAPPSRVAYIGASSRQPEAVPSERASGRGGPAARSHPTERPSAGGEGIASGERAPRDPRVPPDDHRSPRPVALFRGCVMDILFAHVHDATRRTLEANGYTVREVRSQGCCGALHEHAGDRQGARALATRNLAAFGDGDDLIAVNSAGCGAILKDYGHLLSSDAAHAFAHRVRDISELLADAGPRPGAPLDLDIAYDAPCHLQHAQGIQTPVLAVLAAIPGLRLQLPPGADRCCGGAGVYSLLQPTMSRAVLDAKIATLAAADPRPDVVATGNPGCLMQIGAGLGTAGLPIGVIHPVELLDRSYRAAGYYD